MMIYLGDVADGMALLDEAIVSIEAGELSTVVTGNAYCTVIDACAELSDVVRCRSWTASMLRWCDTQQELVLYRGHCFIHSAEVLRVLGRWADALTDARHACDRLAGPVPSALARGHASRQTCTASSVSSTGPRRPTAVPTSSGTNPSPACRCSASPRATPPAPAR